MIELPVPETRYAETDGLSIAYQVFGSGSQDLVFVPGIISHMEENWQYDNHVRMMRRLGQHFRVICFDKRGQGMSDRFDGVPTLEQRMDDVRAVMHAAGSNRAVLFAYSEGGAMGALFTATYPAKVERLVLFAAIARFSKAPDYPHSPTLARMLQAVADTWGTPASAPMFAPGRAGDADFCERVARYQRQTASPSAMRRLMMANDQIDVRAILPQVHRPTLVLQRRGDRVVRCGNGRYLADHIPDAVYLELPGADHLPTEGDMEAIIDAIDRFADATWVREVDTPSSRFLSTVLFTDIVDSTELAGQLGDRAWRDLLQRFHALCRAQIDAFRGREIDTAGDGFFAIFDGPARAMRCADAMVRGLQAIGITIRAGLHTGEVESLGDKVSGMAVHIGARVMSNAGDGQIWVSSTARDLVAGSGIGFEDRGTHALKAVPGEWSLHRALVPAETES
jgi:pimeloyl-ACP methyl ester carboxylesterase/class 3 adenylate cyclase